ncbi:uncharacterized protein [Cherax quadricarinatus]|uniref:uncharacterized protein isoform X4 n=1 Tax=Cherax quadricarinatus TaxID=27406 RepID=UPI00387EAC13
MFCHTTWTSCTKVAEETAASEQQQKQEQQQEQQEVGTSPGSQHSDQTSAPIHINGQDMDASSDEGVVTEEVVIPRRVNTRLAEPWDSFSPIDVTTNGVSVIVLVITHLR